MLDPSSILWTTVGLSGGTLTATAARNAILPKADWGFDLVPGDDDADIDQSMNTLYGHRDLNDASRRPPRPGPVREARRANPNGAKFDRSFDSQFPATSTYSRSKAVQQILAFNDATTAKVFFNDPIARQMVKAAGFTPSISFVAGVNHFHVTIRPLATQLSSPIQQSLLSGLTVLGSDPEPWGIRGSCPSRSRSSGPCQPPTRVPRCNYRPG